ncbi:LuxR C-terminal-related transcriptional regulator [Geodermatophilus sabuli]|uniref:LuxR family transcriptional regulator, maltose regulon positive regulatory protein n=1 Tax=Geodermatophilus sabuli TaxID=1564158 RepID=A0A285EEC0_9ACTN|nr:LuxR C-terminal-related transcriptional regulator [Geodermatophilus sabuli]MBB3084173.1 LuxR family maltose regulon positive regulatory protein [Geodermatophilus sabuli]SNX96554.1 LuxR family transcriptional regulator, maltose regulon positive regulatory protein [Geodermatophilus sabuli]
MGPPSSPLLSVKHVVPPARPGAVVRQRLYDRLRAAQDARLCVVVAPAGWGKTTVLALWAREPEQRPRTAWVSLDASDDEPVRFWTYVLTALRGVDPQVGKRALAALSAPAVEPVAVALPLLINDLAATSGRYVLVLDDVHVLHDRRVWEALEFLVTYLPESLRVVMAARADPALPLARLRARGQLTELRAADLRFTLEESTALVAAVGGVRLPPSSSTQLWERTEGWAVGLQLAALSVRGSDQPEAAVSRLRGDDRHILDYLATEVLDALEPVERDLLVRTSVLDRLSGSLCDAVLGRSGSAEILRHVEDVNLFVAALDPGRRWYRCHSLLRDVLRRELETTHPDAVPSLLGRAADWYAAEDRMDEAARLLIAAGDVDGAMDLLRTSQAWFFESGAAAVYLQLGEEAVSSGGAADAEVFVMLAYAAVLSGRFDRARHWCDAADLLVEDRTPSIDGWLSARACLLTMRAAYGHEEGDRSAADLVEGGRAVHLETDPALPGYVLARAALASAHMRAERYGDAVALLNEAWQHPARALLPTPALLQTAGLLALNLLQVGAAEAAREVCAEVAAPADAVEHAWGEAAAASVAWLRLVEGRLARSDGDLVFARRRLRRAVELAEVWGRDVELVRALSSLAEVQLAAGDRQAAREAATRAREVADAAPIRRLAAAELQAVETRLGRGAVRAARRLGRLHEELTDRELSVLQAFSGPATQREVSAALFLSVNTVKGYTKSLYRKLGASSRRDAVERGRALGLV